MNLKACVVIGCLLPVLTLDSVADSLSDKQINERLKREFAERRRSQPPLAAEIEACFVDDGKQYERFKRLIRQMDASRTNPNLARKAWQEALVLMMLRLMEEGKDVRRVNGDAYKMRVLLLQFCVRYYADIEDRGLLMKYLLAYFRDCRRFSETEIQSTRSPQVTNSLPGIDRALPMKVWNARMEESNRRILPLVAPLFADYRKQFGEEVYAAVTNRITSEAGLTASERELLLRKHP